MAVEGAAVNGEKIERLSTLEPEGTDYVVYSHRLEHYRKVPGGARQSTLPILPT